MSIISKKAQHKNFRAKDRAIYAAAALRAKDGILTPQLQQVAMQHINYSVLLTFREIQLRAFEGGRIRWVRQATLHLGGRKAVKLGKELDATLVYQRGQ